MLNQVQFGRAVLDSSPIEEQEHNIGTALCTMATCIVCWQNHFTSQLREPDQGVYNMVKRHGWGWQSPFTIVSGGCWNNDANPHFRSLFILADNICWKAGFLVQLPPIHLLLRRTWTPACHSAPGLPLETQWVSRCTQLPAVWLQAAKSPDEGLLNKLVIFSWRIPATEV